MFSQLAKDIVLFLVVVVTMTVFFTFTNCGEEGEFESFGLSSSQNFVYISYLDSQGDRQLRKAEFLQTDGDLYIDGDVLIGSAKEISIGQVVSLNNAVVKNTASSLSQGAFFALKNQRSKLWPNNQVPYVFDENMSVLNQEQLKFLIDEFNELMLSNQIYLQLVERTNELDHLVFVEKDLTFPMGGQSYVGRIGGAQPLKIREDNFSRTIVHHEILHALGFKHEHQRSDRKLQIQLENIDSALRYNFSMYNAGASIGKYDIESIMHYHSLAFSNNGEATMLTVDGNYIQRNTKLSRGDLLSLKEVYGSILGLSDGIYSYKGGTFSVDGGSYCRYKINSSDDKLDNMTEVQYNTMLSHGLIPGLKNPPFCH